ncbi:MAG: hypothetical protein JW902_19940 [Syntrophaceae bacterium]|nr:hypothetical protein [Syntrophaceae bacterium]
MAKSLTNRVNRFRVSLKRPEALAFKEFGMPLPMLMGISDCRFSLAFVLLCNGDNILKFSYGQLANTIVTAKLLLYFTQNFFNPWRSYAWTGGTDFAFADLENPSNRSFV